MAYPDWAYYLANLGLMLSQLAIWSGTFCRLPANWILVANAALYAAFFPGKINGLGFGFGSVVFFIMLAVLGEALAYAARNRRKLARQNQLNGMENTFLGAGLGSVVGALSFFWIPLVGPILSLIGAATGAAGGAYVGTLYSRTRYAAAEENRPEAEVAADDRLTNALEMTARLGSGGLIVLLSIYSSFSG